MIRSLLTRGWRRLPARRLMVVALMALVVEAVGFRLLQPTPAIRLAITSFPPYNYFYLASRVPGLLPDGLNLVVRQYTSLEDQRRSFEQGAVEVVATTLPEALAICQDAPQRCPAIVLVLDQSAGADQLVASNAIADVRQLKGRRVGLEHSVLGEYLLLRSLEGSGLTFADLQLHYLGPVDLLKALRRGELDAVVTYAPHTALLQGDPGFRVLFDSTQIPQEVMDVLAVDRDWARRHPRLVKSLVASWWAARAHAAAEPQSSVALMARREQITPQEFLDFERLVHYPGPKEQRQLLAPRGPVEQVLERMARLMREAQRVRATPPLPSIETVYLEAS